MAVKKVKLPNNTTLDINDARVVSDGITYIGEDIDSATYEAPSTGSVVTWGTESSNHTVPLIVDGVSKTVALNGYSSGGGGGGTGEENVIEVVKVNGTALTPDANKAVDVTVPTKVSDLTNDSGFITDSGVVKTTGNQTIAGTKTFSAEVVMSAGGSSDITSGVLCAFKTNRAQITNFATHNILTGGTNSTTPITFYKYTAVSSQAPSSLVQLAKIDTDGNIYEGTTKLSDKYLTSFTETDPTVPSWAKQSTKPSYTASEVGALPDTTIIPTVPTISTSVTADATSDTKTSSPKSVKTYVDSIVGDIETLLAAI